MIVFYHQSGVFFQEPFPSFLSAPFAGVSSSQISKADGGHYVGWTLHKKADGKDLKEPHCDGFFFHVEPKNPTAISSDSFSECCWMLLVFDGKDDQWVLFDDDDVSFVSWKDMTGGRTSHFFLRERGFNCVEVTPSYYD